MLFYDNDGFSDELILDTKGETPNKKYIEIDEKVKRLVHEGSKSTKDAKEWATQWVAVSSTWWRDYAKASGYMDDVAGKQLERTLPGNFEMAMPEYFLTESKRAELRKKFNDNLEKSIQETLLSQKDLKDRLWLHDYVNIPLEAFKAIVGENYEKYEHELISRKEAQPPYEGNNTLYSVETVRGYPGVKVVEKTGERVIVDSQGICLTFTDESARAGIDDSTHLFFSSKCTVKDALKAFAEKRKLDINTLDFYDEVNVPGETTPVKQLYNANDGSELWDTNMGLNKQVKVAVKKGDQPKKAEAVDSESSAEDSHGSDVPAAQAAAAPDTQTSGTKPASKDDAKQKKERRKDEGDGKPNPSPTSSPKKGPELNCENDCYAISLLRALFAANKFSDKLTPPEGTSDDRYKNALLAYLNDLIHVRKDLYTLRHLPMPQIVAGPFLSLLTSGEQCDINNALDDFVEQLKTDVFRIRYLPPLWKSGVKPFKTNLVTFDDKPLDDIQTIINQWLDEGGKNEVFPILLPDVLVVSLQHKSEDQSRRQFDCVISVPIFKDDKDDDETKYRSGKPSSIPLVRVDVQYELVAVTLHVGITRNKKGENGHYVVVTRKPGETTWKLLDNTRDPLKEEPTMIVDEGYLTLGDLHTEVSMCTLFYQRIGL